MTLLLAWILGGPGARRAAKALVAAVAAGLVVHGLLSTGEPAAGDGTPARRPTQAQAAPAPSARRPQAEAPATTGPAAKVPAAKAPASKPAAAAAHWYAKRHGLPASRVRPLQVDQVDPTTVRVLVLVTKPGGGLDSAVVTVRRDGSGWVVPNP
jgi:hypothetical protein